MKVKLKKTVLFAMVPKAQSQAPFYEGLEGWQATAPAQEGDHVPAIYDQGALARFTGEKQS
eukprot:6477881-Amphidinium_carterae.1